MASVNLCVFVGNVTKEVEMRYMPNGDAIANFSIAVNESYKDKSGQKVEKAEFVNIVAYRKLAEIIGEYVKKGQSIYISGKMQTRKWEKDGITRYSTEIIANEMQMLGGRAQNNQADDTSGQASQNNAPQTQYRANDGVPIDEIDSDFPF